MPHLRVCVQQLNILHATAKTWHRHRWTDCQESTVRYHFIPTGMEISRKTDNKRGEDRKTRNLPRLLLGMKSSANTLEDSLAVPQTV